MARTRAIVEAEGVTQPRALVAAAVRPLRGREAPQQEGLRRDADGGAADFDHARRQRRGWYVHLAVFLVGQGLIQLALLLGLLEPDDGLHFGDGPTGSVRVGPLDLTFDVAGLRRVWLVVLVVDFLWSFSYTLWPREGSADREA